MKTLFLLSIIGTFSTFILLFLKLFIKDKVSKTWQYYIWLIVILELLIPFKIPYNITIPFSNQINLELTERLDNLSKKIKNPDIDETLKEIPLNLSEDKEKTKESINYLEIIDKNIGLIWIIGVIIFLVRVLTSYQGFLQYIKAGRILIDDIEILNLYGDICQKVKIKKPLEIYRNDMIASPMLAGIFRPFIVLPAQNNMKQIELKNILLHELVHYKKYDIFYKWLVQFVVCIHWFNPIVYLIRKQINKYCELSCDEIIIKNMNIEDKRAYGNTLLSALKVDGTYKSSVASVTLNENAKQVKERLGAIMNFKKKNKFAILITTLVTGILCFGTINIGAVTFMNNKSQGNIDNYIKSEKDTNNQIKDINTYNNKFISRNRSYFYKDSYIIGMKWNINPSSYPVTKEVKGLNNSYLVAFTKNTKAYSNDAKVIKAISQIISEEKTRKISSPAIIEVEGPFSLSLKELAEEFYKNKNIKYFSSFSKELNTTDTKNYAERAYKDDKINFFSVLSLTKEQEQNYAERAYKDNKINFFSVLSLTKEQEQNYAERAYKDNKISFFSVLSLTKEQEQNYAERAYKDNKINFFSVLSLTKEQAQNYAEQAYKDNKINFFSILVGYLTKEQKEAYAKRAYKDDKVNFFYVLK